MEPTHEEEAQATPEATASEAPVATTDAVPAGKVDLGKRFLAMLIDGVTAGVLSYALGLVGGFFGALLGGVASGAYYVVRDGLDIEFMKQRSLGKKIMKLGVIRLDGKPMDLETSIKRNWMFGLGAIVSVLRWIPILGWILLPLIGLASLAIGLFECYKVLTDKEGRRWGDSLGGTKVVDLGN